MYSYVEIAEPPCYSWSLVLMTWHQFTFVSPLNKHALYYKTSLGENYHWIRKSKSENNKLNNNLILHVLKLFLKFKETLMSKSLILHYFLDIELIKIKNPTTIQPLNKLEILWAMLTKWYPPPPCFVWPSPCFALGNPKIIQIKT